MGFRAVSASTNIYPLHAFITLFSPSSTTWRRLTFLMMDGNPTFVPERRGPDAGNPFCIISGTWEHLIHPDSAPRPNRLIPLT